ncbi:MAG: MarR family transcriptional regulator [Rothia sp. (in: high G+C Gram-positive bacteria)]|uniref:MarR family winged helix-turn-helix transcriptional regulator n=1 Tax=Rothia sp. (in: high G+C Gram-positive bacteria) TaxID=1885016 RepID=UPI0026E0267A|nr:MarR family transcriptional regulator [Rothia sp. (in: high G+C Gram-positive bacteria)]MDO5750440.1 MarR family transcriptional regulator [Rothia sp. (in: high G+C Gram-positive bacteria)]
MSAQPTTPDPAQQQGEETTPWLNSEEREAWLFLSSIIFNLTRQLEVQLQKDSGLSFVEYMVLAMLSESPTHSLTMTELATATNTLPARLSRVVTRLEKDDLVRREPSPSDRRVSICFLLKAGLQKVQQTAPGHVREVRRQIFDHLTPEQVHSLQEIGTSVLGDTPSQVISIDSLMRGTYGDTKREHADS